MFITIPQSQIERSISQFLFSSVSLKIKFESSAINQWIMAEVSNGFTTAGAVIGEGIDAIE